MSDLPYDRENFCYRHPDRQSFVLCQRCGKTICSSCQTQASVGVHCPDCIKQARQNAPKQRPAAVRAARAWRSGTDRPLATYAVLALMVVGFALGLIPQVLASLAYFPSATLLQPWTMLTFPFVHVSPLSLLLDGLVMFLIGRQVEQMIGRNGFVTLFLLSAFAGAVTLLVFVPGGALIGAGPVVWGMFGAIIVFSRSQGGNVTGLLIMLGLFLVLGFVLGSAWQANVGGLLAGVALTVVNLRFGAIRQQRQRTLAIAGIAGALVLIAAVTLLR